MTSHTHTHTHTHKGPLTNGLSESLCVIDISSLLGYECRTVGVKTTSAILIISTHIFLVVELLHARDIFKAHTFGNKWMQCQLFLHANNMLDILSPFNWPLTHLAS